MVTSYLGPHISPFRVSHGVSIVGILKKKNDRIITELYMLVTHIFTSYIHTIMHFQYKELSAYNLNEI